VQILNTKSKKIDKTTHFATAECKQNVTWSSE